MRSLTFIYFAFGRFRVVVRHFIASSVEILAVLKVATAFVVVAPDFVVGFGLVEAHFVTVALLCRWNPSQTAACCESCS